MCLTPPGPIAFDRSGSRPASRPVLDRRADPPCLGDVSAARSIPLGTRRRLQPAFAGQPCNHGLDVVAVRPKMGRQAR